MRHAAGAVAGVARTIGAMAPCAVRPYGWPRLCNPAAAPSAAAGLLDPRLDDHG